MRCIAVNQPESLNPEVLNSTEEPPLISSPVPSAVLKTPLEGLESIPQIPKRVIIVGAGVAGLVTAFELLRQGHDPLILEAQHRVGGRIYTLRSFAPGLYAEAGAMRIPRVHDLTLEYCRLFGLELRPFVMGNPKSLLHLEGQRLTMGEADSEPERLTFELAEHERGRTYTELWDEATREVRELYQRFGEAALQQVIADYDKYSIREFLKMRGFSEGAIELYGIMSFREANLNAAVIEQLREIIGRAFDDMQEGVGGTESPSTTRQRPEGSRRPATMLCARCPSPSSATSTPRRSGPTGSARPSASSTTTPRRRSCSRRGRAFGRCRTASSGGQPPPTCPSAAWCTHRIPIRRSPGARSWPATRGGRTPCAGRRWTPRPASRRPSSRWPRSTPRFLKSSRWARAMPGTRTTTPGEPSRSSSRDRRRSCRTTSNDRRGASTSPASTAPSGTHGSRVRWSPGSGRLAKSTRPPSPWQPAEPGRGCQPPASESPLRGLQGNAGM